MSFEPVYIVDALSRTPLLYSDRMVLWFSKMAQARTLGAKLGRFATLRPTMLLSPVIGIVKRLTDPVVNLMMGQTAENLTWKFGISRQQMDAFSVESHQKVSAAQKAGRFEEIVPHLLHVPRRNQVKRGIASICIGGGQGGAMLVETV